MFNFDVEELKIILCGDWHLGHPACQRKSIEGVIDYVKNSDNTYMILMGDLIESASRHSIGSGWVDQKMTPDDQIDTVIDLLKPIQPKILGAISGNHENRAWKELGFDITKRICRELNVPYWGLAKLIKLRVKDYNYIVYVFHGESKATTAGGKMQACKKLSNTIEADLIAMAHVHHLAVDSSPVFRADLKDKIVEVRKKYYVLTGYFMDYWNTYAHAKAYEPGKTGVAKIKLFGDRHDIHVSV